MAQGLNSTKTPARPSHESVEQTSEDSGKSSVDKDAMESAKRAQNRIHSDEQNIPGSTIFSK